MSVVLVSTRDAALGPVGRKRRDDRFVRRSGRRPSPTGDEGAAEHRSGGRRRRSRKLGGRGRPCREPCDRPRGRGAHDRGDRRKRWRSGRRGDSRHDLAQRALVRMDRSTGLRRGGLDVCARLRALPLQACVRDQRDAGQRELQHSPEQRQISPRHVSTHGRNVGERPPPSNAVPARGAKPATHPVA